MKTMPDEMRSGHYGNMNVGWSGNKVIMNDANGHVETDDGNPFGCKDALSVVSKSANLAMQILVIRGTIL